MSQGSDRITEEDKASEAKQESEQKTKIGAKEQLYDKIPLTKAQLDIIIVLLVIAFIVFFVIGALKGNGII